MDNTMDKLFQLKEAWLIFLRKRTVAKKGFKKYLGTAEQICKQIIKECWNGAFFQVSTGHFSIFYIRDFGMCIEALLNLDYKKEVEKTLQFALHCYSREDRITTTITKKGNCFDVFSYAPDSLAFLLYSLRISKNRELVEIYKPFLEKQIQFFYETVYNPETIIVQYGKNFSSIKDHSKREVTCYDSCCVAVVQREALLLGLKSSFKKDAYEETKQQIKKVFWTGTHFRDTPDTVYVAGDANVFPFWFEIFTDKEMKKKAIAMMRENYLDILFPLKYTSFIPKHFSSFLYFFAKNYEGTSIWIHLGLCYIDVVVEVDPPLAKQYLLQYINLIEKYETFLEVFDETGNPYKTPFYMVDEGMLWCSKFLVLKRMLK